jgi:translation initiation factor IF-3
MAKANQVEIPYLDPSVQHVGISRLRALNVTQLRELDKTLVIQDNDKPLAVLLKYEHFLAMQEKILKSEGQRETTSRRSPVSLFEPLLG